MFQYPGNPTPYKDLIRSGDLSETGLIELSSGTQESTARRVASVFINRLRGLQVYHFHDTYRSLKSIAGPLIAAEIGLSNLRASCPHFCDWVSKLESFRSRNKTGGPSMLSLTPSFSHTPNGLG